MRNTFGLSNCNLGKEENNLTALPAMNQIKESHGTCGTNDIAEVNSDNVVELCETTTWKICKISSIRTIGLMAMEVQN